MKTTKGSYNKKSPSLIDRLLPFGTKRRLFTKLAFLVITKPGPLFRNLNGTNIKGFFYHLCTSNAAAVDWIITSKLQPSTPLDYKQSSVQSNKDQGIICYHPFTSLSFFFTGETYSCMCSVWPKYSIGNIKLNTIAEMWNSKTSQWIRRKMYEGKWQDICKPTCPVIIDYLRSNRFIKYEELEKYDLLTPALIKEMKAKKDYLQSPPVNFQPDTSSICNLRCIMCAADQAKDDPDMQKKLWSDLKHYLTTAKYMHLTGWGEPLAKAEIKELLINYKGPAKFRLLTNGLLLPKYWEQIKHQKLAGLSISVDAATKETYEKIRVGGRWEDLLGVLDLVKQNKKNFGEVMINMTVMRSNYREIPQFIDLAESYTLDVFFQAIHGKWEEENIFELKDKAALEELKSIIIAESLEKRNINVYWGNLLNQLNISPNLNIISFPK